MKKYDINNFYIGELFIGVPFSYIYLNNKHQETEKKDCLLDIQKLQINHAINCDDIFRYINHDKKIRYTHFLALFYKTNQGYLCLQNNKVYNTEGSDFCKNLYQLKNFLPKTDFNSNDNLTISQALKLFRYLYQNKNNRLYKKKLYKIEDFYIGELNICTSFINKIYRDRFNYLNVAQIKMLKYITNKKAIQIFDTVNINDTICYNKYNYLNFDTIFLKTNIGLLNLHNNQEYSVNKIEENNIIVPGENFYENLSCFQEFIENNNIKYNKNTITIKKALDLFKKRIK